MLAFDSYFLHVDLLLEVLRVVENSELRLAHLRGGCHSHGHDVSQVGTSVAVCELWSLGWSCNAANRPQPMDVVVLLPACWHWFVLSLHRRDGSLLLGAASQGLLRDLLDPLSHFAPFLPQGLEHDGLCHSSALRNGNVGVWGRDRGPSHPAREDTVGEVMA